MPPANRASPLIILITQVNLLIKYRYYRINIVPKVCYALKQGKPGHKTLSTRRLADE